MQGGGRERGLSSAGQSKSQIYSEFVPLQVRPCLAGFNRRRHSVYQRTDEKLRELLDVDDRVEHFLRIGCVPADRISHNHRAREAGRSPVRRYVDYRGVMPLSEEHVLGHVAMKKLRSEEDFASHACQLPDGLVTRQSSLLPCYAIPDSPRIRERLGDVFPSLGAHLIVFATKESEVKTWSHA